MGRLTTVEARERRHRRVRVHVRGTAARPRLSIFRSARHIYAQLIDDDAGRTLAAVSSNSPESRARLAVGGTVGAAKLLGELVAQKAKALGIGQVVFDRGGYQYHGRIKALAEATREHGLVF